MKLFRRFALLLALILSFALQAYSATIYVNASASGSNDGSSWANAYASFQSALSAAVSGDKVWVAAGTYKPSSAYDLTNTSRYYHFRMKNGVAIYGGFAGTETQLTQRDVLTNKTILSGDLNGNDVVTGSGATLSISNNSDNCYSVIYNATATGSGLTSTARLDGFTIMGGYANGGNDQNYGGGVYFGVSNSPIIANCTISNNYAVAGGGIRIWSAGSVNFINCVIAGNIATHGGGINVGFSSPVFTNCTISKNYGAVGGGIKVESNGVPTINNSIVWGNVAQNSTSGNQIYNSGTSLTFNYSCYSGVTGDNSGTGTYNTSNNNTTNDPKFANAANSDFRITSLSPCLDAGNDAYCTETYDIRSTSFGRKLNKTDGTAGTIDMGAYEFKFGTDPTIPTVTTQAVDNILTTTATGNGNITDLGIPNPTAHGVVYHTSTNPTTANYVVDNGAANATGTFTANITGLSANTQYYVRAYSTNIVGTVYGSEVNFYTLAIVPSAPTVTNATPTTLYVGINVNGNPTNTEFAIQEAGGSYVQADKTLGVAAVWQTAATWFPLTVTGLTPATSYTFKVKARNGGNVETNFSTTASRYTLATEPANHASDFTYTAPTTSSSITLTWTDAFSAPFPTHYLVKASTGSLDNISNPFDATAETDAALVKNVAFGVRTVTFTGLNSNTAYYFKIYPYRGTAETINYLNTGYVPELTASTQVAYPSEQATDIGFANITRTSMKVYWTRGDGTECILLGREKYRIASSPLTDGVVYTANTNYDLAQTVSGAKVLYTGTGTNATITGLTRYMLVYFKVCEYNDPSVGSPLYLQDENASNPRARWTLRRDAMMEEDLTIDAEFAYPNPAKNSISTTLDVYEEGNVSATLYDIEGRKVIELYNQTLPFGSYNLTFDISKVSSGVYQLIMTKGSEAIAYPVAVAR